VRQRIQASAIVTRFIKIAEGKLKGDPKRLAVQVMAGKVLLAKVMADKRELDVLSGGRTLDQILIEQLTGAPPPQLGVVVEGVEVLPPVSENHAA
jgi:hypothetical protein